LQILHRFNKSMIFHLTFLPYTLNCKRKENRKKGEK